ncbi:hypothetical protein Tco_0776085, partial [Tanacetum coccineum]
KKGVELGGVKEKEGLSADNDELNEASGTNHDTSTPKVVNEVGKDAVLEFFPPLSTPVTTTAGNASSKSSYANIIGKPSGKKMNVCTLFTSGGNGIDVVVPKWHPDENLLKEDVSIVLVWVKLHGVSVTAFREDGLSAISTKLGAREKKTVKKPSQTSRGVPVGPKIGVEPTIEGSNSNPFEVLNSIDNDVEFGTNEGTNNLVNNGATSTGSSFMNIDNSSISITPIIDKIRKFEELLTSGQAIFVDKAGNHLKKVEFPGEYDNEDEVASVDNDMTRSMASERVGQDLSQDLQAICDNLDIRVRGRKK